MAGVSDLENEWAIRVVVVVSLLAHVVLALFAGVRRRESAGWRTLLLWGAYQASNWAAPYALANLFRGSSNPQEQQLLAFWVPFLLAHMGGPDSIAAYSLEDNKLSLRQVLQTVFQAMATAFALYKQVNVLGGEGALFWGSAVMAAVGAPRYVERAYALWQTDFGKIRSAMGKKKASPNIRPPHHNGGGRGQDLDDEQALLLAHELLHVTKGAFADYSPDVKPLQKDRYLKEIFSTASRNGWENMRRVVEMELSLMYDVLYTKAAVIHTRASYSVRLASPVAAATATLLFLFYGKAGQRRASDVVITYSLLAVEFLLDVRWLLAAAASTWAHATFSPPRRCRWLQHQVLSTGRWRRFRDAMVSLDPRRLLCSPCRVERRSYRLWSGTIGRYNLLREVVTHDKTSIFSFSYLVKMLAPEDAWMEYRHSGGLDLQRSRHIKELLFDKIREALAPTEAVPPPILTTVPLTPIFDSQHITMAAPYGDDWKHIVNRMLRNRGVEVALDFVPEYQERILTWHIATDVFLRLSGLGHHGGVTSDLEPVVEAIKAVSDYMVFLAAVRPDMLPGLKLGSMYYATGQCLEDIWKNPERMSPNDRKEDDEDRLVYEIMETMKHHDTQASGPTRSQNFIILSDAIKFASSLNQALEPVDFNTVPHHGSGGSDFRKGILFSIIQKSENNPWTDDGLTAAHDP